MLRPQLCLFLYNRAAHHTSFAYFPETHPTRAPTTTACQPFSAVATHSKVEPSLAAVIRSYCVPLPTRIHPPQTHSGRKTTADMRSVISVQPHRRRVLARHDPFRQLRLDSFPISSEKISTELRHLGEQHIASPIFRFVGNVQYFRWLLIWMRRFDVLGCHLVLFHFYGSSCVLAACPCRMKNDSVLHLRSPLTFLCRQGKIPCCRALTAFIIAYL